MMNLVADTRPQLHLKAMSEPRRKKRKLDYRETIGSRIVTKYRKEMSKLTREQRRAHFKRAMVRIYGGQPKEAPVAGH